MFSTLDWEKLVAQIPDGLDRGADPGAMLTGTLLGLDTTNGLAQVSVAGGPGVWVPAQPAIYPTNGLVRLLRSPLDGGRTTVCLGPVVSGPMLAGGVVKTVSASVGQLTVTTLGADYVLPYAPGTYEADTPVHVIRSASKYGLPEYVLGPSGNYNSANPGQPGAGSTNPGQLVDRQAVILPQWTGSWRSNYARWDTWNTNRYGGRSTLWQGNGYGSGPMIGLAVYGDQIVNLRAVQITRMQVSVYRADSSDYSGKSAGLQPSPHGTRPGGVPAVGGEGVGSPPLAPGQGVQVDLPGSVLEGFRTGGHKGLASIGGAYMGISGTPERDPVHADGMALVVQYKVRV